MKVIKIQKDQLLVPPYIIDSLKDISWLKMEKDEFLFHPDDMMLILYGTRGSTSYSGPHYLRYGSNTTSYQIFSPKLPTNYLYLGDGGSGILEVSAEVLNKCFKLGVNPFKAPKDQLSSIISTVINTYTHYHYDHLHFGAPLAGLFHTDKIQKNIIGGDNPRKQFQDAFRRPVFPRDFDEISAAFNFYEIKESRSSVLIFFPTGEFKRIGSSEFLQLLEQEKPHIAQGKQHHLLEDCLVVKCYPAAHPDPCISFRYENYDGSNKLSTAFTYLTDHEMLETHDKDHYFIRQVADSDFLYIDGQYDMDTYIAGFGHGRVEVIGKAVANLKVYNTAIGHHDPNRTDDEIDRMVELAREHHLKALEEMGDQKKVESKIFGATDRMMVFAPGKSRGLKGVIIGRMDVKLGPAINSAIGPQNTFVGSYREFDFTREYNFVDYTQELQ